MNLKFKRNVLFLSATILIASMSVIISSCSSDEDTSDNGIRNALIDSVAESDEFLDYVFQFELVKSKFTLCINSLNNDELEIFNHNINNDEYIDGFIVKAELSEDVQLLLEYRDRLLSSAFYCKLEDTEKDKLFVDYFNCCSTTRSLVKDSGETLYLECWQPYQSAISTAEQRCSVKILGCLCTGVFTCPCVVAAYKEMDNAIARAKSEFEDCQRRK